LAIKAKIHEVTRTKSIRRGQKSGHYLSMPQTGAPAMLYGAAFSTRLHLWDRWPVVALMDISPTEWGHLQPNPVIVGYCFYDTTAAISHPALLSIAVFTYYLT